MESIKHFEDGEVQRIEVSQGFTWSDLSFRTPPFSKEAFDEFVRLYRDVIIPKDPSRYGTLVFLHVPDDLFFPFSFEREAGTVFDKTLSFALLLEEEKAKLRVNSDCDDVSEFFCRLENSGWIKVLKGKGQGISIMPVSGDFGFMSDISKSPSLCVNSHFFIMEKDDRDSPYDLYGEGFGLAVKDGCVLQPPLFGREALIADEMGHVSIAFPSVKDLFCEINNKTYRHGSNCVFYERPQYRVTPPSDGTDIVVIGRRTVAYHDGGNTCIPSSGFVIQCGKRAEHVFSEVICHGMEQYCFAVQAGPAVISNGKLLSGFSSPYFDSSGDKVSYPPVSYPPDYNSDRAPRMIIGAGYDDNPVIIWAEGESKLGHVKGIDSIGMSLMETAMLAEELGLKNAVNLDGGGSALMLNDGMASLHVSGRFKDGSDAERPVPLCITAGLCY